MGATVRTSAGQGGRQGRIQLHEHQRLATCGARTALPVRLDGDLHLIVPQLAEDLAGQPAHMNGGDSDVDALMLRWSEGGFRPEGRLPTPGGEDAEVFRIGGETYLAMASIRQGAGPYDMKAASRLYRREAGGWSPHQDFSTFAARQWRFFTVGERAFLALAQGAVAPGVQAPEDARSRLFAWDGRLFAPFQTLEGAAGYNWETFELEGGVFLAYADHTSPSRLYRWGGEAFSPVQDFSPQGGRAFRFFEASGRAWLAVAVINGETTLHQWRDGRFEPHQVLGGPGGREFTLLDTGAGLFLVRVRFIEGTPADPVTALQSEVYAWSGEGFEVALRFPTFGGTDAEPFEADGQLFLAVANSLTPDIRFRQDSVVYRVELG